MQPEGGFVAMPKRLHAPGLLFCGDGAGLVNVPALKGIEPNFEQIKFVAEDSSPDLEVELEKLKAEFPGSRITKTACEPSAETPGKANTAAQ